MPIEPDDVSFNKAAIIERCLNRVFEVWAEDRDLANPTHLDSVILNLERACQAAIDLGMHVVAQQRLGMPQDSADAFALLARAGHLQQPTAVSLAAMVGFQNVAIHEYQRLDLSIVRDILTTHWTVFVDFARQLGLRIEPVAKPNQEYNR
jgi:uncharacterized protein YutE (UPF0331/DUF86 family)